MELSRSNILQNTQEHVDKLYTDSWGTLFLKGKGVLFANIYENKVKEF